MAIPVNIDELIHGRSIESERLEFKAGWNPAEILHTSCAFANDLNNWGGGYLIIGIAESEGRPLLPPIGLDANHLDKLQKELVQLCHKITPNYFPVVSPVEYQGKHILVLWCPGGDTRPHKASVSQSLKKTEKAYYIRRFSTTVKASPTEEQQLISMAAKIPFDDRINHQAELSDLNPRLIKQFLTNIKSDLHDQVGLIPFADLYRQMQLARGPCEYLKPINAALLLFADEPSRFFPGAKIEVIDFHDDIGDRFTEKIFTGPIHQQLLDALRYINSLVITEHVQKVDGQAEADRCFNYPFASIEEALANAVYHRSYEHRSTIEVSIRLDRIDILSFPGPLPPVTNEDLKNKQVISRDYRNRRISDFLKELHLTEGRNTGFPKISRALEVNGSPVAEYTTDIDRISFLATIQIHPTFLAQKSEMSEKMSEKVLGKFSGKILEFILKNSSPTIAELSDSLKISTRSVERALKELKDHGYLERIGSRKEGSLKVNTHPDES